MSEETRQPLALPDRHFIFDQATPINKNISQQMLCNMFSFLPST